MARNTTKPTPTTPSQQLDLAGNVLRQFRQVFSAVRSHFAEIEKKVGIGGAHVWVLHHLKEHPDSGVGRLALALDIHQSTASNLVKSLIERQLVQSTKGGSDRRVVQLRLLPAGERLLARAPGPFTGVLPDALRRMDAVSLQGLSDHLDQLLGELQVHDRDAKRHMSDM